MITYITYVKFRQFIREFIVFINELLILSVIFQIFERNKKKLK